MSSNFKDIRAAIVTALQTSEHISQVYDYEASTPQGFPAAIVAPSENEADYGSTATDRLVFVFKVALYYLIENESNHEAAEDALEVAVDDVLTILRPRSSVGSCDWVMPSPSRWYYEERGEAIYRVAEITVKCVKYVG